MAENFHVRMYRVFFGLKKNENIGDGTHSKHHVSSLMISSNCGRWFKKAQGKTSSWRQFFIKLSWKNLWFSLSICYVYRVFLVYEKYIFFNNIRRIKEKHELFICY
jgi:hypothetical protein